MNGNTSIERRIASILSERMAIDVPSAHTDLIQAGYLDSMALVELLQHIERELDVRLRAEDLDLEHLRSIARLASLIASGKERDERGAIL